MRIYIMRHGEVFKEGEPKKFLGVTDVPMSEEGKKSVLTQAEKLAENAEPAKRILVASPLKRCRQTADILQEVLPFNGIYEEADFREIDLGEWEMQEIAKVKEERPEEYRARGEMMADFRTPGGDTFRETGERFAAAFRKWVKKAAEENADELFIISHRGAVLSGIGELSRVPLEEMLKMTFGYADIIAVDERGRING